MKLLITWFSTGKGGAEKSILDLSSGLVQSGNRVVLLYLSNYHVEIKDQLDKRVTVYQFRLPLGLYKWLSFFILTYICLREKPDLVNHNFRCLLEETFVSKLLGIERVATVRAIVLDKDNADEYARVKHVVAISRAVAGQLKKIGYKGETHVIYNGINMKQLKRFDPKKRDKNMIYFMARLVGWKRVDMFVRAAVKVKKRLPKAEFYIFGDGPGRGGLEVLLKKFRATKYIHYFGEIDVNSPILEKMGIFVLTSLAEPFGKTIVEAVVRKKVVVGSNSGAVPELIPLKQLLFKSDSEDDLVEKIIKANEGFDYYKRKFDRLSPIFEKAYDITRTINNYQQTFLQIYAQKKNVVSTAETTNYTSN